jgi:hypothetical protein
MITKAELEMYAGSRVDFSAMLVCNQFLIHMYKPKASSWGGYERYSEATHGCQAE